jgi:hypothetical protein
VSRENFERIGLSRGISRRQQKKRLRSPSFDEIVPASDEEDDGSNLSGPLPLKDTKSHQSEVEPQAESTAWSKVTGGSSMSTNVSMRDGTTRQGHDNAGLVNELDPLFDIMDEDQSINMPSHRVRAANPLVKMVDDPHVTVMDGAISVKTRLSGRNPTTPPIILGRSFKSRGSRATGVKPEPGRSSSSFIKNSLLTFEKGSLKTVKGSYKPAEENKNEMNAVDDRSDSVILRGDEIPALSGHATPQPPTADELLGLAGLDAQKADEISDFEEDPPTSVATPKPTLQRPLAAQPDPAQLAIQQRCVMYIKLKAPKISHLVFSLAVAKDKLFPSSTATGAVDTTNTAFKRSSIFDSLLVDALMSLPLLISQ